MSIPRILLLCALCSVTLISSALALALPEVATKRAPSSCSAPTIKRGFIRVSSVSENQKVGYLNQGGAMTGLWRVEPGFLNAGFFSWDSCNALTVMYCGDGCRDSGDNYLGATLMATAKTSPSLGFSEHADVAAMILTRVPRISTPNAQERRTVWNEYGHLASLQAIWDWRAEPVTSSLTSYVLSASWTDKDGEVWPVVFSTDCFSWYSSDDSDQTEAPTGTVLCLREHGYDRNLVTLTFVPI